MYILANILALDNTQIRIGTRTAVLNAFSTHTSLFCATHFAARSAVLTISLHICSLHTLDVRSRRTSAVRITAIAGVLTDTILTKTGCRIRRWIVCARIIARAAVLCVRTVRILTCILPIYDTQIRGRTTAAVLDTTSIRASLPFSTDNSATAAIVTVALEILILYANNTARGHALTAFRIAWPAFVLAHAKFTDGRCRRCCWIIRAHIVTSPAMLCIGRVDIAALISFSAIFIRNLA